MTTTYFGPAKLSHNDLTTLGIARIYLIDPSRWQGEFRRGDAGVLWSLFGENVILTLEHGKAGKALVQGFGSDNGVEAVVNLVGSGDWPLDNR